MLVNIAAKRSSSGAVSNLNLNHMTVYNELLDTFKNETTISPIIGNTAKSDNINQQSSSLATHSTNTNNSSKMTSSANRSGIGSYVTSSTAASTASPIHTSSSALPLSSDHQYQQHQQQQSTTNVIKKHESNNRRSANNDEEIIGEEDRGDCIYLIKFKKIYNQEYARSSSNNDLMHFASKQSSSSSSSNSNNNTSNGTYRPLQNDFRSYLDNEENNKKQATTTTTTVGNTLNKHGLVYSKVKIKQLKYASLKKFVECLTSQETGKLDMELVPTFLATYRTFTDTKTALTAIQARYEEILPASLEMTEDVRLENMASYRTLMRIWVEEYADDFYEKSCLDALGAFLSKHMNDAHGKTLLRHVESKYETSLEKSMPQQQLYSSSFSSIKNNQTTNNASSSSAVDVNNNQNEISRNLEEIKNKQIAADEDNDDDDGLLLKKLGNTIDVQQQQQQHNNKPPLNNRNNHHHRRVNSSNLELKNKVATLTSSNETGDETNSNRSNGVGGLGQARSLLLALSPKKSDPLPLSLSQPVAAVAKSASSTSNNIQQQRLVASKSNSNSNLYEKNFMNINSIYFALQLTYLDKTLFQNVCAHYCLADLWNTRHKVSAANAAAMTINNQRSSAVNLTTNETNNTTTTNNNNSNSVSGSITAANGTLSSGSASNLIVDKFASINDCVNHFNIVSFMVQSTILEDLELKPSSRAKIIEKWIEIGNLCKKMKNYSSLNAIVQGLNIPCISRLTKTWNEVLPDYKREFNGLAQIFSEEENQKLLREILNNELTIYKMMFESEIKSRYKVHHTRLSEHKKSSNHERQKSDGTNVSKMPADSNGSSGGGGENNFINATLSRKMKDQIIRQRNELLNKENYGTIPFLGTFLKDLEYMSAIGPTKNANGLINVQAKQREYEIIAQMKLFQRATQLYTIEPDDSFKTWLYQQPIYSEAQNYELSDRIEPKNEKDGANQQRRIGATKFIPSFMMQNMGSLDSLNSLKEFPSNKTPSSTHSTKEAFKNHSRTSSNGSSDFFVLSNNNNNNNNNNHNNIMLASQQSYGSSNGAAGGNGNGAGAAQYDTVSSNGEVVSISSHSKFNDGANLSVGKSSPLSSSSASTQQQQSSKIVIKVSVEYDPYATSRNRDTENLIAATTMYKLIHLKDSDRTKDVKRNILEKFHLDPATADEYLLYQLLNNATSNDAASSSFSSSLYSSSSTQAAARKELAINDNCNVFYACSSNVAEVEFVLRKKTMAAAAAAAAAGGQKLSSSSSSFSNVSSAAASNNIANSSHSHHQHSKPINLPRSMSTHASNSKSKNGSLPPQSPGYHHNHNHSSSTTAAASATTSNSFRRNHQKTSSGGSHGSSSGGGGGSGWIKKILGP